MLGLHRCEGLSLAVASGGCSLAVVRGLLVVRASLAVEEGFQAHGLQQLWQVGSVVVAPGL